MQQCINNMDRTVQSFVLARWEQDKVDMEELPLPQPLDLGTGRCSSTIVKADGCGATIKSRQELLQGKKRKWSTISSQKRNMLANKSPMNDSFYVCPSCYWHESKRLSEQSSEIVGVTMPSALVEKQISRNLELACELGQVLANPAKIAKLEAKNENLKVARSHDKKSITLLGQRPTKKMLDKKLQHCAKYNHLETISTLYKETWKSLSHRGSPSITEMIMRENVIISLEIFLQANQNVSISEITSAVGINAYKVITQASVEETRQHCTNGAALS